VRCIGLKLLMTMLAKSGLSDIGGLKGLPNGNMALREAYGAFSRMNIFLICVSPYTEFTCVTMTAFLRCPSLRAKVHWHTLCFTTIYQPSITVKPVRKLSVKLIETKYLSSGLNQETGDITMNILHALKNDENGFVVSAELVLVGTILVLGMIVGLTELSYGVNEELEDLGSAIGAINQTYYFTLASGRKGEVVGSTNLDFQDECDNSCDITCNTPARGEKHGY